MNYISYERSIKHCTVKLKDIDFPKHFKIGFLRGSVDTDGCVSNKHKKRIRIMHFTTSKTLAKQIKLIAKEFNINGNIYKPKRKENEKIIYVFQVFQRDVKRFLKIVKPFKIRNLGL